MVLTPLDRINLPKRGEKRTDGIVWDLERTIPEIHQTRRSVGTGQAKLIVTETDTTLDGRQAGGLIFKGEASSTIPQKLHRQHLVPLHGLKEAGKDLRTANGAVNLRQEKKPPGFLGTGWCSKQASLGRSWENRGSPAKRTQRKRESTSATKAI